MGNINIGNQLIGLTFGSAATSLIANFVEYAVVPTGIYKGGILSQLSASQVSISPLVCFIDNDTNVVGIRVETTSSVTLSVSSSTPFIVLRFSWVNTAINFMDVLAVSAGSIQTDDLILGKCIYVGGVLQSFFDLSKRSNGWSVLLASKEIELLITPNDPVNNILNVAAGTYLSGKGFVSIATGVSPIFLNTILGRYDILYVDSNGIIQISQGVDSSTPVAPDYQGQVVIAEIHRGANRTTVRGDEIVQLKSKRYAIDQNISIDYTYLNLGTGTDQIQAGSFGILDSQNTIFATNVETALTEVGNSTVKAFTVDPNELNTINPGNVVNIFNGNIRLFQDTSIMGNSQLIYTSSGTGLNEGSIDTLSPGVMICAFYNLASPNSAVKVVVITTSGKVATPGTIYEIENFTNSPYRVGIDKLSIKAINSTTALLVYEGGNSGSNTARAVILTITGTVITWTAGNIISFNTGGANELNMVLLNSTHALVVYVDGSVNKTTSIILTIAGTVITAGTKYQPDSTNRVLYRLRNLFTGNVSGNYICMILWDDGVNLHTEQISINPASSYAITWNAEDTNGVSYITNKDQSFLFIMSKGLAYYINDGVPTIPQEINYTEGVFTSRVSLRNSATNFVPRGTSGLEISPNTHILFGADSANGSKGTAMLYRWKNGIPFTSMPMVMINNAISNFSELGYIDESHILHVWCESSSTLLKCSIMEVLNNFDTIIGVALNTAIAGQTCNVAIDGIVQCLSSLTPGALYMLRVDGSLTSDINDPNTTEPIRIIGKALSTTQLQLAGPDYV